MGIKVGITGSAGYLGSEIVHTLLSYGFDVVATDNLRYHQFNDVLYPYLLDDSEYSGVYSFARLDCRDTGELASLFAQCDVIIPLAALVGLNVCNKYVKEAEEVNYEAIRDLLPLLSKDQYVIFPNTNSFYGKVEGLCTEETPGNPLSHYAKTKYAAECEILDKHEKSTILRLATVFGKSCGRTRLDLLVNDLAYRANFVGGISIFEGAARRNFVHVADVAIAFRRLATNITPHHYGVFNFGNDDLNMTKIELAQIIGNFFGVDVIDSFNEDPDKRDYNVSSAKLRETAGIVATIGILDGLHQLKDWFNLMPHDHNIRDELLKYNRNI